jgi:hypothetical protein
MARLPILALIAGATALLAASVADAQQQQRQRQPRSTPQAAPRAQPAPPLPVARVQSDPTGAACTIVGPQGQTLTRTFGTPEAVPLANRGGGERVVCNKPGFGEARAPLAAEGQTTTVALAVDPRSRVVTRETIQPGGGVRIRDVLTADQLVALRQGYLAGKVSERQYFAARRYILWADSDPVSQPHPIATPVPPLRQMAN